MVRTISNGAFEGYGVEQRSPHRIKKDLKIAPDHWSATWVTPLRFGYRLVVERFKRFRSLRFLCGVVVFLCFSTV